jgi:amino acid adenylation domain-containing protein
VIANLIHATVKRAPDDLAVLSRDGALTYRELWRRAGQVVRRLRDQGADHREPVGLLARPSADGITGILATLRIGAPYVGMCPSLPAGRTNALIKDSGARFVLHARDVSPDLLAAVKPVGVHAPGADGPGDDGLPAPVPAHPLAPCAIIYTSGSTGGPKGVVIPQRAMVNRLEWGQRTYPLGAGDRVLHHTRYIYDFSAWEVLAALAYGATLVVESFRNYPDFEEIASAIKSFGVSTAHFVPSILAGLVRRDSFWACTSLTTVFSGGEALSLRLAEDFRRTCGATLYNQYGPTETCVDSSFFRYEPNGPPVEPTPGTMPVGTVPIGRAIDGTHFHVLDPSLHPVAEGGTGELYIGGTGLATGYLGRPGLTSEHFVPDPFHGRGERLYRTGDLVRRLENGLTQFVGRVDWQLNLRGVRLEPAEIEVALESHPRVIRAAAAVIDDPEPHLVAFIAAEPGAAVSRDELREQARATLPPAAVPDRFFVAESLPLLPNGKVDRRAVRDLLSQADANSVGTAPVAAAPDGREPRADPAVPVDLAAIWAEVLGVDNSGPDDDFFELGGHSLLAAELITVINERLGADVPLAEFFELPTLARAAELLQLTAEAGSSGA